MRFLILLFLAMICGVPVPVLAADPVITIHPDGSFSVDGQMSEIAPASPAAEVAEPAAKEIPKVELQSLVSPSPVLPPRPSIKPARRVKKEAENTYPAVRESIGKTYVHKSEPRQPGPVTREEALRLALSIAPPSRGTQVYPADYNGLKVFQVVFKVEDGEHHVFVDRQTGEIVEKGNGK